MMIIEKYKARSDKPLAAGKRKIEIQTTILGSGKSGTVKLFVDGENAGEAILKRTVPAAFTATETFDVGIDLGLPVSSQYAERRPFEFDGTIHRLNVKLKPR